MIDSVTNMHQIPIHVLYGAKFLSAITKIVLYQRFQKMTASIIDKGSSVEKVRNSLNRLCDTHLSTQGH